MSIFKKEPLLDYVEYKSDTLIITRSPFGYSSRQNRSGTYAGVSNNITAQRDDNYYKNRNENLEGKKYFTNEEKDQILEKRNKVTITRASELAKILKKELKNKSNLKILETGCNEGLLLTKLNKKINNGFFYGLDKNRYNKKNFPTKSNFHFLNSPDIE